VHFQFVTVVGHHILSWLVSLLMNKALSLKTAMPRTKSQP